ncbi:Cytochrome P450 [Sesbania bispinosa]|nr:Cytochrome P450 [Sesbania bispinosa]
MATFSLSGSAPVLQSLFHHTLHTKNASPKRRRFGKSTSLSLRKIHLLQLHHRRVLFLRPALAQPPSYHIPRRSLNSTNPLLLTNPKDETNRLIHQLAKDSIMDFAPVELTSMFHDMTYNNMMRMISGKRYYGDESDMKDVHEAKEFRDTVAGLLQLAGVSNKADYLPFLRWFDFQNVEKRLKNISKRFDTFLNALIHENRTRKNRENTMIDHLLNLQESQPEYYTDQIIKGLTLAMLFAGTDSSAVTLEWAISNLLNHPEVILETLRLYPPAPLHIPHVSSDDITIEGFNVPRDTIVMINCWAMQRDPTVWDEATCFKPERFEKEGEEKKLVAFGLGRRACPGEGLAMQSVSLTLGLLIQCFDWKRVSEEEIDMNEQNWFTLSRLIPLKAMCKARPIINKVHLN